MGEAVEERGGAAVLLTGGDRAPLRKGFHRIRHYGLFAHGSRAENIACIRNLLRTDAAQRHDDTNTDEPPSPSYPCPCCGGRMLVIETFGRGYVPTAPIRVDTS